MLRLLHGDDEGRLHLLPDDEQHARLLRLLTPSDGSVHLEVGSIPQKKTLTARPPLFAGGPGRVDREVADPSSSDPTSVIQACGLWPTGHPDARQKLSRPMLLSPAISICSIQADSANPSFESARNVHHFGRFCRN
ncbi:MAG TPA: hypothetical protein VKP69_27650 [Isosphaeraceae bacterium]|nr:hypothetical protein [Isosphaeraceae bacterium]